jgi:hypothetical protein
MTRRPFTEMVYQPMLELLAYLRANGFKTFIVSGGGVDFMRAFSERVYGIPPDQVVGSSGKVKFELQDGKPVMVKLPAVQFIDDKAEKPVAIHQFIGRRPIAAFGNSDGDLQMSRRRRAILSIRPPHGCGARMDVRPAVFYRSPRQGAGRGQRPRLDRREHQGRLEDHISVGTRIAVRLHSG